jgi:hypothetical protein
MLRRSLLSLGVAIALGSCGGCEDSSENSEGLEALQAARAKARAARYLVAVDDGGQRIEFAPGVTVISRRGRVLLWARRDVEYALSTGRGCYERHTDFERADLVEVRRDIVVPQALIDEAELAESGGHPLIRWRGPVNERGSQVEGRLYLDRARRPVLKRERIVWAVRHPRGGWLDRRYRYPANLDLDPPEPRCP